MSTIELKNKLIAKIEKLEEDSFLHELLSIIDLESNKGKVLTIPAEHRRQLEISLKQMDEDQTLSHDEAMKMFRNAIQG